MPSHFLERAHVSNNSRRTSRRSTAELLQQLPRSLVANRRQHDLHLDDQVAGLVVAVRGRHAVAPARRRRCPEDVPGGTRSAPGRRASARRLRAPSAASCTATGNVTCRSRPIAPEKRMLADVDGHVQVAGRSAARAGVAAARHRDARARSMPGGTVKRHDLAPRLQPDRRRTCGRPGVISRPCRRSFARLREHHVPARPAPRALARHRPDTRPPAAAPGRRRRTPGSAPAASRDSGNGPPRTASRNESASVSLDVRAARRRRGLPRRVLEHVRRTAPRTSRPAALRPAPRNRTPRTRRRPRSAPARRLSPRSYSRAALQVGQHAVGLLDLPEHLLGDAVTRIDARVIPPRQPPVRALDLVGRRRPAQPEKAVQIHGRVRAGERTFVRSPVPSSTSSLPRSPRRSRRPPGRCRRRRRCRRFGSRTRARPARRRPPTCRGSPPAFCCACIERVERAADRLRVVRLERLLHVVGRRLRSP